MKRILTAIIILMCCALALAESDGGEARFDAAGFVLHYTGDFADIRGSLVPYGGQEVRAGSGVYVTQIFYLGMTQAEYEAADEADDEAAIQSAFAPLFTILSIDDNRGFESINALYGESLNPDYAREIARVEDMVFYAYHDPESTTVETALAEEYDQLLSQVEQVFAQSEFFRPLSPYDAVKAAPLSFTARDLEGNVLDSATLFGEHEFTLLNIWATWCPPCVGELSELSAINRRLEELDCAVVGLLADGDPQEARSLMAEKGADYTVLVADANLLSRLYLEYYPTTYIVDRQGQVVGDPIIGAAVEQYEESVKGMLGGQG